MINPQNTALIIIEQLASNEELIAKLYRGYAETFLAIKDFWESLAREEMQHASWIRNLGSTTENPKIFIDEHRFNAAAIQSYTNYIDKELNRLKKENIQLIEALSITLYIEKSLIENSFFEVFAADSAELKNTLSRLREETKAHLNKAKEELENIKTQANLI